ncbi:PIN domain-containing protein [bacterium]|nr:PIN domain-containing protein [bacterium]
MLPIFVDTSGWYAFLDKDDANHESALKFIKELAQLLITSNYIIDETLTLVNDRLGHNVAIKIGQKLWNEEIAQLVRVTSSDEQEAWKIFVKYQDKGFSFTDCTSFVLIERLGIPSAFAFDDYFRQYAKFYCLPPIQDFRL